MASVMNPGRREKDDALTTVLKGLQIAQGIYGIKTDMAQLDAYAADQQAKTSEREYQTSERSRRAKGILLPTEQAEIGKLYDFSDKASPGSIGFSAPDGSPMFATIRQAKEKSPPVPGGETPPKAPKGQGDPAPNPPLRGVSPEVAKDVGGFASAYDLANMVDKKYDEMASSFGSSLYSKIKGTDASNYENYRKATGQTIGQILEGGKLTDSDRDFYIDLLPTATDTNEQKKAKMDALRLTIQAKEKGAVSGLKQSGFNTSGFNTSGSFPKTVINPKTGQQAVVNDESELKEAQAEGFN